MKDSGEILYEKRGGGRRIFLGVLAAAVVAAAAIFFLSRNGCTDQREAKKTVVTTTTKTVTDSAAHEGGKGAAVTKTETREVRTEIPRERSDVLDIDTLKFMTRGSMSFAAFDLKWSVRNAQAPMLIAQRFERVYGVRVKGVSLVMEGSRIRGMYILH